MTAPDSVTAAPEFPEWAPECLALCCTPGQQPLIRFLTDPRMERVWAAIRQRTDNPNYPFTLWFLINELLLYRGPNKSKDAAEKQNSELAHHLQKAIALFDESCLDTEGNENKARLIAMEQRARDVADALKNDRIPGMYLIDRPVNYPGQTRLARSLTARFRRDFNQPLWETTALLIEVALDLPEKSIKLPWIRHTCG